MKLTSRLKLVKPVHDILIGAACSAVLTGVALSVVWTLTDNRQARLDAYGTTLAATFAQLTVEPLLKQDGIHLVVLANRLGSLKEVNGIVVYTVDNEVLAMSGDPQAGARYTEPVTFDDSVLGYVRVALNPEGTRSALGRVFWAVAVVLAAPALVVAGLGALRSRAARAATVAQPVAVDLPDEEHLALVVNLYDQLAMAPAERQAELASARRAADLVVGVYGGEVQDLPGTGLLVTFPDVGDPDSGFQALCACLVLGELLAEEPGEYRLGVHGLPVPHGAPVPRSAPEIADAVLLSALAKRNTVAVSNVALAALDRPERLTARPLVHPLLDELTTAPTGAQLVLSLESSQQALVTEPARHLAGQWRSTASESTF